MQGRFGTRLAGHDGVRMSWRHFGEAKSAVETEGGVGEAAACVLGLSNRVVDATDGALDVGEHGIDPTCARNLGRGAAAAGFEDGVGMTGVGLGVWRQTPLGPVGQRSVVKGPDRFDDDAGGVFELGIGLDRDQEGQLVFGVAPGLAAVALAAEIGIVDLREARKFPRFFSRCHGLHDLVLEAPGSAIGHAEVALEFECREVGFGRGQQMDREEPGSQRQLRVLQQRAADQRRLVLAGATLIERLGITPEAGTTAVTAGRTAKSHWPSRPIPCAGTSGLAAIPFKKLGHRKAPLELDQADHRAPLVRSTSIQQRSRRSCESVLRFGANQERR